MRTYFSAIAAILILSGSSGAQDTISTAGVLCHVAESGDQRLVYMQGRPGTRLTPVDETLPFQFAWSCDAAQRTLAGNGVPNHSVDGGEFATRLSAQRISQTFPLEPVLTTRAMQVKEPGFALNSVKFDPGTAGTCPDTATVDRDCDYGRGRDTWRMVATPGQVSPWKFGFGVDENDAHVQPNGQYHYHGTPVQLMRSLNPDHATSMTLVGWALDGFPIYSSLGHSTPNDSTSTAVELRSSYQLVAAPGHGRPSIDDFPLGHFEQDWVYVEGAGDLDECNGRFGVTPEFPEGTYAYHITQTYPFVTRCLKGAGVEAQRRPPRGPRGARGPGSRGRRQ